MLIIETLLNSYKNLDIILKFPILNYTEYKPFKEMLMKSTNYKKLHINFIHQETKEHCIRNNIEFTSNIGL